MMRFREVKEAIINVLGAAATANGTYRVIGYQDRNRAAEEALGDSRLVEVFCSSGDFPKSAGDIGGTMIHDPTIQILLTVASRSLVDLSVLDDPGASDAARAAALLAAKPATSIADDSMDELIELVYQVLMDAAERDFGLTDLVANKWIPSWRKDAPLNLGEYVILGANMTLEFRVDEEVDGDSVVPADVIDTTLVVADENGDDTNGKAGYQLSP
jgi:hypothetical protein